MTIWFDDETGELIEIDWTQRFCDASALMQADVLQDILGHIETDYENAAAEALPQSVVVAKHPKGVM